MISVIKITVSFYDASKEKKHVNFCCRITALRQLLEQLFTAYDGTWIAQYVVRRERERERDI